MPSEPDYYRSRGAIDRRHTLNSISKGNDPTSGGYKIAKRTSIILAECTEQATENHQDTSNHDGNLATPSISDEGSIRVSALPLYLVQYNLHERETEKTTNLVNCIHQSQLGATGSVEVHLPCVQILGGVKHHSAQGPVSSMRIQPKS